MLESLSVLLLMAASLGGTAPPDTVEGAYTTLDLERGCTVLDRVPEGEPGSWVRMVCDGYRGYPVFYSEGDLRVSLAYGFPGADGGDGCVVGYVDAEANEEPDELARRVADEVARAVRCGADEPAYHGETSEATPRPSRSGGP